MEMCVMEMCVMEMCVMEMCVMEICVLGTREDSAPGPEIALPGGQVDPVRHHRSSGLVQFSYKNHSFSFEPFFIVCH